MVSRHLFELSSNESLKKILSLAIRGVNSEGTKHEIDSNGHQNVSKQTASLDSSLTTGNVSKALSKLTSTDKVSNYLQGTYDERKNTDPYELTEEDNFEVYDDPISFKKEQIENCSSLESFTTSYLEVLKEPRTYRNKAKENPESSKVYGIPTLKQELIKQNKVDNVQPVMEPVEPTKPYDTRPGPSKPHVDSKSSISDFSSDDSRLDVNYKYSSGETSSSTDDAEENTPENILPTYETLLCSEKSELMYGQEIEGQLKISQINFHPEILNSNTSDKLKKQESQDAFCPLCFEDVSHFARHLFRKHPDDEMVKKITQMPIKSNERRSAILALRKKGNFILSEQKKITRKVREPNEHLNSPNSNNKDQNQEGNNANNYFPCTHCFGFYKKEYLWRHNKVCKSKISNEQTGRRNHLSESQTFLATTGLLGNYLNKSRIKKEVFDAMRPDDISLAVKTDPLICLFGESYINKHKRKQMNMVVSNKMRELGRLKLALMKSSIFTQLMDVLKPESYELIVTSTKVISGYNAENKTYKASSLALHMGTTLKFVCDVAKKAIMRKNPLFSDYNRLEKLKQLKEIHEMITMHWCNDVSSLANKVLNEQKYVKPKLLSLTEDVKKLNIHIKTLSEEAFNNLRNNKDITLNYKLLAECTLVLVLIFNRKRVGEVQFLDVKSYENPYFTPNQEECLSSLTPLEKNMCAHFKRVVVFGKGSKPVPILFTKVMQKYIDLLLAVRKTKKIVPISNPYIFANPDSNERWISGPAVLTKFAHKCGAKNPELLTSTKCRKQIATILQLMNFEKDEMEQIARFMGHTEKTHMEFYRLTEDVYQTAKVAKVLMLLDVGKGSEFKGKHLNEIEITEDALELGSDYGEDGDENEGLSQKTLSDKEQMDDPEETLSNKEQDYDPVRESHNNHVKGNETKHTAKKTRKVTDSEKTVCVENDSPKVKTSNRVRWLESDKKVVLRYFKNHIKTNTAPKKKECIEFINFHSDLFNHSDWIRIKTLVFNTYRNKNA